MSNSIVERLLKRLNVLFTQTEGPWHTKLTNKKQCRRRPPAASPHTALVSTEEITVQWSIFIIQ